METIINENRHNGAMKALAEKLIADHNWSVEYYINVTLAAELGAKDGMVSLDSWFKAQELIREQKFYERAMAILRPLREEGFDVKINMQDNTLTMR